MPEDRDILEEKRKNRCAALPSFLRRVRQLYEEAAGETLESLFTEEEIQKNGALIPRALTRIRASGKGTDLYGDHGKEMGRDIDVRRSVQEMTLSDMELFSSCLNDSLREEYLLLCYKEPALWSNPAFDWTDPWDAYGGLFQEARSPVINLKTMDYASLPYARFRDLGEAPSYSQEEVKRRIQEASLVEFTDKLDGSLIQITHIKDPRFFEGNLVPTSGTLNPQGHPSFGML